jgi:hypothetical protein
VKEKVEKNEKGAKEKAKKNKIAVKEKVETHEKAVKEKVETHIVFNVHRFFNCFFFFQI